VFIEGMIMITQYYFGFEVPTLGAQARTIVSDVAGAAARVGGTFGEAGINAAAAFLAASLSLIITAFLAGSRFIHKQLALAAILPGLVALVLTGSRGGWISFFIALLIIIARAILRRVGVGIMVFFTFAVVILAAVFSSIIIDRFIVTKDEHSHLSRIWYSQLALNYVREDVFTGAGANNQQFVLDDKDYAPPELAKKKSLTRIHNKYLAVWVELGLFGFLGFLWVLLAGARRAWITSNETDDRFTSIVATGLLAALTVFMVHMIVATYTDRRMQFIWLLLGLIAATSRLAREAHKLQEPAN
jgi:O-antigen ligase